MNLESKARINSLISAANATTGKADTDLTSAVGALIAGFGQGGGDDHTVEDSLIQAGALVEYRNDRVTEVRAYAFSNCTNLISVDLPNVYKTFGDTFAFSGKLSRINLPSLTSFSGRRHFQACSSLEFIKLPKITALENDSFDRCTNLKTIVLPQTKIVKLSSTSAFSKTPYASGGTGGTVYVPSALIAEYQQATNWSILYTAGTCNFVAIEGSEYE